MNKSNKIFVIFYFILFVGVLGTILSIDSTLERPYGPIHLAPIQLSEISYSKIVDIEKEKIFNTFADFDNYSIILSGNILSVNNTSEKLPIYDVSLIESGIKTNLIVEHIVEPYDKQIIKVIDGDAQGTTVTQTFESYGNGTKILINIDLKTRGSLIPFSFLPELTANNSIDNIITSFVDYSTRPYSENEIMIDEVYKEILQRPADPQGLAKFSIHLEEGDMSIDEVRETLLNSEEYHSIISIINLKDVSEIDIKTKDFLDEIYDITLRRNIDPQGLQYFGSALENNIMTEKDIIIELLTSKEFNSLPIETRDTNDIYESNEYWQTINHTSYQIHEKYPDKKIIRAYGIFFEKNILDLNDIINLLKK